MISNILRKLANSESINSFANKLRRKRFRLFKLYFPEIQNRSVSILDLGGTCSFWRQMGFSEKLNIRITLMNIAEEHSSSENILAIKGDACDLSVFPNAEFDIVFSNSVIEHVGNENRQQKMAKEINRVGKGYFVQTPNYWFPIEQHFLFLGFQFLPISIRVFLIMHLNLGWYSKVNDKQKALEIANSIHLLSKKKIVELFPDAIIIPERFFFLIKSYVIIRPISKEKINCL